MVDFDSLEVQVEVPETSLQAVRVGAPVQVFLDAFPATPYAARVERIWPTANRQKATVEVRVGFEAPDERLRPEMGVRAVFADQDPEAADEALVEGAILVPLSALASARARSGVFVLEDDRVRFRALELGPERGARVEVRAGLAEGERVVLEPPEDLEDGQRVLAGE
jgi:RND family efflux transporter MFP subunit